MSFNLRICCVLLFILFPIFGIALPMPDDKTSDDLGGHLEAKIDGKSVYFPTLKTAIDANIQGDLVTVTVKQTFANPLDKPLHATYLFPLNKDAAVYEMIMEVGDERVRADIQRIEQAQATFKKAKREGKSAALLTQHRPNMFTQDIANLMPDLPIHVTLRYVQNVAKKDGAYELVIPLVVGPRFQPVGAGIKPEALNLSDHQVPTKNQKPKQGGVAQWDLENPPELAGGATDADSRTHFGSWEMEQLPDYAPVGGLHIPDTIDFERVSLKLQLNSAVPIQTVDSATHQLKTDVLSDQRWDISLASGTTIDNRDFVLRYRLEGQSTQAGVLTHRDERGGFFSLLLEPPASASETEISPREMVFVLDCSGSMSGLPIEASKTLARTILQNLRPSDSFRIIRFSDKATEFSTQPLAANVENIQRGIEYLNSLRGSGGTVMSSGIKQALTAPLAANSVRMVMFLTDGYIGNEFEVLGLIHQHIDKARLFSFGVGTSVNRFLLSEMGRVGHGFARYLDPTEDVDEVVAALAQRLQSPVLTDMYIDWGDSKVTDVTPQPVPDLFAGQSLRIMGRYQQPGTYQIAIHGRSGGVKARLPLEITLPEQTEDGNAIALTWARSAVKQAMHQLSAPPGLRIDNLSDNDLKQQVVKLGLDYSLITKWTAFVAVSEKIYNTAPETTPTRPVPLAQVDGVSEKAYGKGKAVKPTQPKSTPKIATNLKTRQYAVGSSTTATGKFSRQRGTRACYLGSFIDVDIVRRYFASKEKERAFSHALLLGINGFPRPQEEGWGKHLDSLQPDASPSGDAFPESDCSRFSQTKTGKNACTSAANAP